AVAAGPEAGRRHFAVVGFLRHAVRQRRDARGGERRAPAREAGDREIQRAPEQVDGTGLAEKRSSELVEYPVHGHQGLVVAPYGLMVIGPVAMILTEGGGEGHLVG